LSNELIIKDPITP